MWALHVVRAVAVLAAVAIVAVMAVLALGENDPLAYATARAETAAVT